MARGRSVDADRAWQRQCLCDARYRVDALHVGVDPLVDVTKQNPPGIMRSSDLVLGLSVLPEAPLDEQLIQIAVVSLFTLPSRPCWAHLGSLW